MSFSATNHPSLHVAIIPDGNRRWAKKRGLAPWEGHREGAKRIEELTEQALELGVKYLTFWGSSKDNLTKRPMEEKKALLEIYEEYFGKLIGSEEIYENETRINLVGRWREQFPKKLKQLLEDGLEKTKNHSRHFLNFLLAYNGDDDMMNAVEKITESALEKGKKPEITDELIRENLLSSELPNVDLIIRTGVENDPHNSAGFLMWQTQNSQFYFSEKKLPDFGKEDFKKAVEEFRERDRRMGK